MTPQANVVFPCMVLSNTELQEFIRGNPGCLDRMFVNDEMNWRFLNRVSCGIVPDANVVEREIAAQERFRGKQAASRKLEELGIITISENPDALVIVAYQEFRRAKDRSHACWGSGRKTNSVPY